MTDTRANLPVAGRLLRALRAPAASMSLRVLVGLGGGYALTYFAVAAMTLWLPGPRAEAALWASAGSFLLYLGAIIYAFAEPHLGRLCGVFTLLLCTLSLAVWQGLS